MQGKYFAGQFTTDVVASTVFGLKSNSFKDEKAPFRAMAAEMFKQESAWAGFVLLVASVAPRLGSLFRIRRVASPG